MRRRTLVGTVATLGPVALIGLFAALSILFSSPTPAYAESPQPGANVAPVFDEENTASRSVVENTAADENIGAPVAATDLDAGDTLIYSLGGTDAASFAINVSSGQLKTEAALDYEAKPTYTVEVTARDASSLSDTITVTVNVTNVNEDPTFGERAAATRSVSENTATNTNIGDPITATDLDAGDTVTYSLVGTYAASFAINALSG